MRRIVSVVALASMCFLLLAAVWSVWERDQAEHLGRDVLHAKREDFRRLAALNADPIRTALHDYSHWDELVEFTRKPDEEWAKSNIDGALYRLEVDGAWIVDKGQHLRREVLGPALGDPESGRRVTAEIRRKIRSGDRSATFFLELPDGLCEVFVASIHHTGDVKGTGPRFGAIAFARVWNPQVVGRLAEVSDTRLVAQLASLGGPAPERLDTENETGHFWIPLAGAQGRPAAYLIAESDMPGVGHLGETGARGLVSKTVFALTVLALLLGTLWFHVRRPLTRLMETMRDGRLDRLPEVRTAGTEFATLADAVEQVFSQRAQLEAHSLHLEVKVRERTREMEHQACSDALTGLVNRKSFVERLNAAFERGRETGQGIALAFIDLDDFKQVNDTFGHEAGDRLLVEVAERLRACVRSTDIVARLGGDEFTVVLLDVRGLEDVEALAARIHRQLSLVVLVGAGELTPKASVGMAWGIPGILTAEELLRNADLAMYQAKAGGKGRHAIFHDELLRTFAHRLQAEVGLRDAIEQRELTLHYQPIVHLATGAVEGYEALTRWNHPTRGAIPPSEFIPVAEQTGLIHKLGAWVIDEACRQMQVWEAEGLGSDFYVSVNLSPRQLADPGLVGSVARCLEKWDVPASRLQIEVTESTVMEDPESAIRRLGALRVMGLRIAIDDFGTGQSSFAALHDLPADTVKLDRVFVTDLAVSERSEAIVRAIIEVCRQLRLNVTAEGVESAEQRDILRRLGCHNGQGFLFGRPVRAADARTSRCASEDVSSAA